MGAKGWNDYNRTSINIYTSAFFATRARSLITSMTAGMTEIKMIANTTKEKLS
jgi:hypothetical protein